jgi:hypothetical protein
MNEEPPNKGMKLTGLGHHLDQLGSPAASSSVGPTFL